MFRRMVHAYVCLVASVVSNSLQAYGPQPARFSLHAILQARILEVGCHFLLHRRMVVIKKLILSVVERLNWLDVTSRNARRPGIPGKV